MTKKHFLCEIVDAEKCKGCTNCVKICPTEAIRVRKGTARTIEERCINCGNCIRTCPYHAKIAITDPLDLRRLREFKYTIALCSPVIYSQFHRLIPPGKILNAVKSLGFDDVFQESIGADSYALAVKALLNSRELKKPVISSTCPAVVKLIQVRFPSLIDNLAPLLSPMEIAARLAREQVSRNKNLSEDEIGIFMITPCTAKATAIKHPIGMEKSQIDGAISLIHLYGNILNTLGAASDDPGLAKASGQAIGWARSGGETITVNARNYLVADGLHNVISIFEEAEMGHFQDVDYIECLVCHGGCVGGPLTIENPFIARIRTRNLVKTLPNTLSGETLDKINKRYRAGYFHMDKPIEAHNVMHLNKDITKAIQLVSKAEEILKELPGLDCCSCGSPSCRALAEDISQGYASVTDCIFKLLETIQDSAQHMLDLIQKERRITKKGKETKK
ncbi:MAG: ferredoxin [Firmicutes bacterium HGW-Firmicutes-14]|nr:MAG: ferredoxin [Firmicutes bacterium HGW-Firmicutes-14]